MALDLAAFLEPIDPEFPCGPDLDEAGDGAFFNYTLPAENRLPGTGYVDPAGRITFEKNFEIEDEEREISALLERSRDLRLVVLLAQFEASGQRLDRFIAVLELIRRLIDTYWDDIHPVAYEGDFALRQAVVEGLDDKPKVAQPLRYLALAKDKQVGSLTLRAWEVALKPELKLESETVIDWNVFQQALENAETRGALEVSLAHVLQGYEHLQAIRNIFREKTDFVSVLKLDSLLDVFEAILKLAREWVPELIGVEVDADGQAVVHGEINEDTVGPEQSDGAAAAIAGAMVQVAPPPGLISSTSQAAAFLVEIERYFQVFEPSSPALFLVHQARKLVGRPLIEALEALAPSRVDSARIQFDKNSGFSIDAQRIRSLSQSAAKGEGDAGSDSAVPITTRPQVVAAMTAVEHYLGSAERSSPVPMLLAKARGLMNKDFQGLLAELFQTE